MSQVPEVHSVSSHFTQDELRPQTAASLSFRGQFNLTKATFPHTEKEIWGLG